MKIKIYWWILPLPIFAFITWGVSEKDSKIIYLKNLLPQKYERIITLAPSLTEIVSAIGGGEKIVGTTESCDYPEEILGRTKVANHTKIYFETILALKPDLILAHDNDFISKADLKRLSELKQKVVLVPQPKLNEIPDLIDDLGNKLMLDETAASVSSKLRNDYNFISLNKFDKPYKILIQLERTPLYIAGENSLASDIVNNLGGINITEELLIKIPYPRISVEAVLNANPDVILIPISNGDYNWFKQMKNDWAKYKNLSAVKNNRICFLDASTVVRPGPRVFDGVKQVLNCVGGKM